MLFRSASATAERGVDVVHLHGATNAMVGYFLRRSEQQDLTEREKSPAIVYTLHDSLDEVEYSNLVSNSLAFLDDHALGPAFVEAHSTYIVGPQLFASALGIDVADAVTFVSRSIAADIVEGRFQFALRDLVMPSIARRAADRTFVGITNGLDFTDPSKNPFTSPALVSRGLGFPRVGANVTDPSTFFAPSLARQPTVPLSPPAPLPTAAYSSLTPLSFASTKQRAKQHLIAHLPPHFGFTSDDADRPFFLFIGRFQYNKGCQFFAPILQHLSTSSSSGRLILLGARNNYPHAALRRLALSYPSHLTLIDSIDDQRRWGTLLRMASDFALVPSFSEAFGLVAAEGLLFGMSVVSSNVGGLAEFLVPIAREADGGNAYTFDLVKQGDDLRVSAETSRVGIEELGDAVRGCVRAVEKAVEGWVGRSRRGLDAWSERESFVRSRVADALKLKWSREKGPIEEVRHSVHFLISSVFSWLTCSGFVAVRPSVRPRPLRPPRAGRVHSPAPHSRPPSALQTSHRRTRNRSRRPRPSLGARRRRSAPAERPPHLQGLVMVRRRAREAQGAQGQDGEEGDRKTEEGEGQGAREQEGREQARLVSLACGALGWADVIATFLVMLQQVFCELARVFGWLPTYHLSTPGRSAPLIFEMPTCTRSGQSAIPSAGLRSLLLIDPVAYLDASR